MSARIKFSRLILFIAILCLTSTSCSLYAAEIIAEHDAHVGEQAVLSVNASSIPAGGSVEWSVSPTTGKNPARISLRSGGRELAFTPLDTQPLKVTASFIDRNGNTAHSFEQIITPKEFDIAVEVINDKPLTMWDASKRSNYVLKPETLMANTPIKLRAQLLPAFEGEHSFTWTADAATAVMSQDNDEIFIKRGSVGESEVTLTAYNANGIKLGSGSGRVNITLPISVYEESSRQREAWNSWKQAQSLWENESYSQAVELAARAASLAPRDNEISEGVRAMNTNYARYSRAVKLREEAANLTTANKLDEALRNLRAAQVIWPLDEGPQEIKEAEDRVNEFRLRQQEANWLRDTASAYDNENLFEEALDYYSRSIAIMSNDAVADRMTRIRNRLTLIADADRYAGEGNTLEREGKLQDALNHYAASIMSNPDATLKAHMDELQNVITRRERQANALYREGQELEKRNRQEALRRYTESVNIWPNDRAAKKINDLRNVKLAPDTVLRGPEDFGIGTRLDAQKIINEADELYSQGKLDEALALYKKAGSIASNPDMRNWLSRFEASLKERDAVNAANKLIYDANALYKAGKKKEALDLYRQSLNVHPNPEIEAFLRREGASK
ncbi:MAG: hypothetical protein IJP48_10345 [Synergistaceae bacterium]|nr:hypothetical protein [Synergistaceae bacterium]